MAEFAKSDEEASIVDDATGNSTIVLTSENRIRFDGSMEFCCKSYESCIDLNLSENDLFFRDCQKAFTSRNIVNPNDSYSTGSTFFLTADSKPRCLLEKMAKSIFDYHTKDAVFDPSRSGAEWWALVIDSRDDVGFHWDRDYGIEEDEGVNIHPHLGTVTYLSDRGGPTIVTNKKATRTADDSNAGNADYIFVSKPRFGKHIKFDGLMLHAAPSGLLDGNDDDDDDDDDNEQHPKRVTFLVNIWLNHIPIQSAPYPDDEIQEFQCAADLPGFELDDSKLRSAAVPLLEIPENTGDYRIWKFVASDKRYAIAIPMPDAKAIQSVEGGDVFEMRFSENNPVRVYETLSDSDDDEEEEEEEEDADEDGESGEDSGNGEEEEEDDEDEEEDDDEGEEEQEGDNATQPAKKCRSS